MGFSGRAPRSKYWFWTLFVFLVSAAARTVDAAIFSNPATGLFGALVSLGLPLRGITVSVRRLHDLDCIGWWLLLVFTGIGISLLLMWDFIRGTAGFNRFGPDPLA